MPIFWKCVAILELNCNIFLIAAVSDGAPSNRRIFKMHMMLDGDANAGVVCRTVNLFRPNRFIYFISDPPHLVKTSRNCLLSSKSGPAQGKRYMWNAGKYIVWQHISKIYHADVENGLKLLPRISNDHIN